MFMVFLLWFFFFFKQKTAYERRISDWSSDVCSSDLCAVHALLLGCALLRPACDTLPVICCLCDRSPRCTAARRQAPPGRRHRRLASAPSRTLPRLRNPGRAARSSRPPAVMRSEEQPSELQSLMSIPYAVFCLK